MPSAPRSETRDLNHEMKLCIFKADEPLTCSIPLKNFTEALHTVKSEYQIPLGQHAQDLILSISAKILIQSETALVWKTPSMYSHTRTITCHISISQVFELNHAEVDSFKPFLGLSGLHLIFNSRAQIFWLHVAHLYSDKYCAFKIINVLTRR